MLQIYKIFTFILALTGCLSLVISGEVNLFMSLTGIGLFFGYYRFLNGSSPAPKYLINICSILTLMIFLVDSLFLSSDYFLAIAHLTITFQTIKSFDLKEPWDHLHVYFMTLLQLIIASVLMYSVIFGLIFLIFLLVSVNAIVFSHFIKEGTVQILDLRKPVIIISLLTLITTVIFFISIPRISRGIWSKGHIKRIKSIGFSKRVQLGSLGEFKRDDTVVMRVELNPMTFGKYYWRGIALDHFDGTSWRSTFLKTRRIIREVQGEFVIDSPTENTVQQKIMLEPIDTDIIFGLSRIISIKGALFSLEKDPTDTIFLRRKGLKRIQYIVSSDIKQDIKSQIVDFIFFKKYIEIPDYLRKELKSFTEKILKTQEAIDASDLKKAYVIEKYLKTNYKYSLNIRHSDNHVNPVIYFLFQSKTGFCEHFATAMTLMLRSIGIPARIVNGFLGGELNTYGNYFIVRQSNAHSWVEAMINDIWIRFDPTPVVPTKPPTNLALYIDMLRLMWNKYIIAFNSSDQVKILRSVTNPLLIAKGFGFKVFWLVIIFYVLFIILIIVSIIILLKYRKYRHYNFVTKYYIKLQKFLKNKGVNIKPSSTPSEIKKEAIRLGIDNRISEFIKLYEKYRFGDKHLDKEGRTRYSELISEIKKQLK